MDAAGARPSSVTFCLALAIPRSLRRASDFVGFRRIRVPFLFLATRFRSEGTLALRYTGRRDFGSLPLSEYRHDPSAEGNLCRPIWRHPDWHKADVAMAICAAIPSPLETTPSPAISISRRQIVASFGN